MEELDVVFVGHIFFDLDSLWFLFMQWASDAGWLGRGRSLILLSTNAKYTMSKSRTATLTGLSAPMFSPLVAVRGRLSSFVSLTRLITANSLSSLSWWVHLLKASMPSLRRSYCTGMASHVIWLHAGEHLMHLLTFICSKMALVNPRCTKFFRLISRKSLLQMDISPLHVLSWFFVIDLFLCQLQKWENILAHCSIVWMGQMSHSSLELRQSMHIKWCLLPIRQFWKPNSLAIWMSPQCRPSPYATLPLQYLEPCFGLLTQMSSHELTCLATLLLRWCSIC